MRDHFETYQGSFIPFNKGYILFNNDTNMDVKKIFEGEVFFICKIFDGDRKKFVEEYSKWLDK